LQRYVTDHLELHYPGCTLRQPDSDKPVFEVSLSIKAKHELEQFIKSERLSIPTRLIHGGSQPVLCRFENRLADPGRGLQEVINHFHPLVRFISHLRKASGDTAQQA